MAQYKQVKSFSFTGKLIFKEENLLKTKEGSSWRRLQFGITDGVTTQYVEVSEFGAGRDFETQVNKTSGDGFEKEIISWSDRHNSKVIEKVAGFRQLTLNLGSDKETKQTFIHQHDFIEAFMTAVQQGQLTSTKFVDGKPTGGSTVYVSGQIKFNLYDGKVTPVFQVQNFMTTTAEKYNFNGGLTVVFAPNAIEDDEENKKLYINCHVQDFYKEQGAEKGKNTMMKQVLVLPYGDMEKGEAYRTTLKKYMEIEEGYKSIYFGVKFFKGAEEVKDFKPTPEQLELVEMGLLTMEEVEKQSGVVGKMKTELRIAGVNTKGIYSKIVADTPFLPSDFGVTTNDEINLFDDGSNGDFFLDDEELPF